MSQECFPPTPRSSHTPDKLILCSRTVQSNGELTNSQKKPWRFCTVVRTRPIHSVIQTRPASFLQQLKSLLSSKEKPAQKWRNAFLTSGWLYQALEQFSALAHTSSSALTAPALWRWHSVKADLYYASCSRCNAAIKEQPPTTCNLATNIAAVFATP